MDLRETYNRIAEDWCTDHNDDTWWIEGADAFISLLPKNGTALDVGCAGGIKTMYLLNHGIYVTGIDLAEKMIEIAKQNVPEATFFVKDILQPLRINEMYDGIFIQAVLLHIPKKDVPMVLKHLTDVLKPGGIFYAAVKAPRPGNPDEEVVKENDYGYDYERFFSYFTQAELEKIFRDAGLQIVRSFVYPSNRTHWVQVIARKH